LQSNIRTNAIFEIAKRKSLNNSHHYRTNWTAAITGIFPKIKVERHSHERLLVHQDWALTQSKRMAYAIGHQQKVLILLKTHEIPFDGATPSAVSSKTLTESTSAEQ
jgi:hypothetical protein